MSLPKCLFIVFRILNTTLHICWEPFLLQLFTVRKIIRQSDWNKPHDIHAVFFRNAFRFFDLVFIVAHDDELPFHHGVNQTTRIPAFDQFTHVAHHAIKLSAHAVFLVCFFAGTVQRHHKIFQTTVNQTIQIFVIQRG